jgi:hypothetical protein
LTAQREVLEMPKPELQVSPKSVVALRELYDKELRHHRIFVAGRFSLTDREPCSLVLRHPTGATFTIPAEAVYLKSNDPDAGAGLDLIGLDASRLAELESFVAQPGPGTDIVDTSGADAELTSGADTDSADQSKTDADFMEQTDADANVLDQSCMNSTGTKKGPGNIHERIRQLSLRERESTGRSGMLAERVALERAFGGSVWESLLQNPQLTAPEVARIAKNGSLPIPLVSIIVGNGGWLGSGEVRRALLSNPRVSGLNLDRVLRATPRVELKQVAQMTAYRSEVRAAAQKLSVK